jgi:hypothetical protein
MSPAPAPASPHHTHTPTHTLLNTSHTLHPPFTHSPPPPHTQTSHTAPPKKKRRVSGSSSDGSDGDGGSGSDADYEDSPAVAAAAAAAAAGGGGGGDAAGGSSGLTTRRGTRFGAGATQQGEAVVCESKLQALLRELAAMREADPTSKVSDAEGTGVCGGGCLSGPKPRGTPRGRTSMAPKLQPA